MANFGPHVICSWFANTGSGCVTIFSECSENNHKFEALSHYSHYSLEVVRKYTKWLFSNPIINGGPKSKKINFTFPWQLPHTQVPLIEDNESSFHHTHAAMLTIRKSPNAMGFIPRALVFHSGLPSPVADPGYDEHTSETTPNSGD